MGTIKEQIEQITEALDMGALGVSRMMGISIQMYRNKKSDSQPHNFNDSDYNNLVKNLRKYIQGI